MGTKQLALTPWDANRDPNLPHVKQRAIYNAYLILWQGPLDTLKSDTMTHNTEYKPSLRHAAERFEPSKGSTTKEQMDNTMSHNTECQPSLRHVGLSMWPWKYEKHDAPINSKKHRKRNGTNHFGCGGPWRPASGATCLPLRGPSSRRNCPVDAKLWFAICACKPRRSLASSENAQPCGAQSHSSWVTASRLQGMDGIQLRWGQVRRHAVEKQCKTKAGRANRLHTTWNALIPPPRCARK